MKTRANEAAGVPFTLPAQQILVPQRLRCHVYEQRRTVAVDGARSHRVLRAATTSAAKVQLSDGSSTDYLPTKTHRAARRTSRTSCRFGHRGREGHAIMIVDTVYIKLSGKNYARQGPADDPRHAGSNYDWTRPIYLTQPYILPDVRAGRRTSSSTATPTASCRSSRPTRQDPGEDGTHRPRLRRCRCCTTTFRYGNLDDPRVYADYFIAVQPLGRRAPATPSPAWPRS